MTQHPITDIHDAETEAKALIEEAKKRNDKAIIEAKEKAEKELLAFTEAEKEVGKEKIATAKNEAAGLFKDAIAGGERDIHSLEREAEMRKEQAVRIASKAFLEYVGIK